jgi:hypothetical protein
LIDLSGLAPNNLPALTFGLLPSYCTCRRLQAQFDMLLAAKIGADAAMLDPRLLCLSLRFCVGVAAWCRLVCSGALTSSVAVVASESDSGADEVTVDAGVGAGASDIATGSSALRDASVSFPLTPPPICKLIPEELLASAMEFVTFVGEHGRSAFNEVAPETVQTFLETILAFLMNPQYIHSPHLRARLGDVRRAPL